VCRAAEVRRQAQGGQASRRHAKQLCSLSGGVQALQAQRWTHPHPFWQGESCRPHPRQPACCRQSQRRPRSRRAGPSLQGRELGKGLVVYARRVLKVYTDAVGGTSHTAVHKVCPQASSHHPIHHHVIPCQQLVQLRYVCSRQARISKHHPKAANPRDVLPSEPAEPAGPCHTHLRMCSSDTAASWCLETPCPGQGL